MQESNYSVVTSGDIKPGYELERVLEGFAALFKLTPEKARAFVGVKRVIKKDMAPEKARALMLRLESIGLDVVLKEQAPKPALSMALSVEPVAASVNKSAFACPKCNLEQVRTDQCTGCGVYFSKLEAEPVVSRPASSSRANSGSAGELQHSRRELQHPGRESQRSAGGTQHNKEKPQRYTGGRVSNSNEKSTSGLLAIAACAVVAVMGAYLWKFIAVTYNYELGIVAWLVGGAVGLTAAMLGAKGEVFGACCAVLTVIAIFSGKFMIIESLQADVSLTLSAFSEEESKYFKQYYNNELAAADAYRRDVYDDKTLRQFLVDFDYSESYEADNVSADEVADFKQATEQRLRDMASQKPDFEQWFEGLFRSEMEAYSTMDLIKEDLGIMDFVFLSLGVVTAFRLGNGEGR